MRRSVRLAGWIGFGSLTREQSGFRGLDDIVQDAKFALRLLIRNPRFAFGAILVLGLGIGINNMYFTLIYGHTMRGLPIEQPDRVLHVSAVGQRDASQPLSFPEFEDVRHARTSLGRGSVCGGADDAERRGSRP